MEVVMDRTCFRRNSDTLFNQILNPAPSPYQVLAHQRSGYVQPYLRSHAAQACRHYKHQKQPICIFWVGMWVWGLGSKYSLCNGWCQWSGENEHNGTLKSREDITYQWTFITCHHNPLHLQDIKPTKPISGRAGKNGEKVHSQTSLIPSHLSGQPSNMTKRAQEDCRDRNGED